MQFSTCRTCSQPTIEFNIHRQVQFGQAVYVVGSTPELGSWNVALARKLSWQQGHHWKAEVQFAPNTQTVEWKYVVASWSQPARQAAEWEAGEHNRCLTVANTQCRVICENLWNMDDIILYLLVPRHTYENQKYFVSVGKKQSGWEGPKQMLEVSERCKWQKFRMFTHTLQLHRGVKKLHYCYYQQKQHHMKMCKERVPIRKFDVQERKSLDPRCRRVEEVDGKVAVFQSCNFQHLVYSHIDEDILIGPYLRDCSDMEKLREEGVEAVLAIQSAEDHSSHQISPHYLQLLCTEFSITYRTHSILDANAVDFIEKCLGAVRSLIKLIKQERKKVYIHCSAGMFRSPQIVTLYLVIEKRMGLDEAMCFVRQKHRYAQPSAKVLNTVVRKLVGRAY